MELGKIAYQGFPRSISVAVRLINRWVDSMGAWMAEEAVAFLASTDLLAGVPNDRLKEIHTDLVEVRLAPGDTLFRQGDVGDAVYLVKDGAVRVEIDGITVATYHPGQWLGEIALVDQGPRSAGAVAETAVRLLRWDRAKFLSILVRDARVATGIFRVLSAKLRQTTDSQVRLKAEQERLRQDLRRAREIQEGMLPAGPLRAPGVEAAGFCRPAAEVGGDYFDYLLLPDGGTGVIIGDVTGHGFYSSLLVAMAKSCLFTQARTDHSPAAVISAMSDTVGLSIKRGLLMTCCYVVVDTNSDRLLYANAGHPHPYLLRPESDRIERLDILDPLLGVQDLYPGNFREQQTVWGPDHVLVLYSDGITEVRNADGDMLGEYGLEALILESRAESAEHLCSAVVARIDEFQGGRPQADDLTLVVVRGRY